VSENDGTMLAFDRIMTRKAWAHSVLVVSLMVDVVYCSYAARRRFARWRGWRNI